MSKSTIEARITDYFQSAPLEAANVMCNIVNGIMKKRRPAKRTTKPKPVKAETEG